MTARDNRRRKARARKRMKAWRSRPGPWRVSWAGVSMHVWVLDVDDEGGML